MLQLWLLSLFLLENLFITLVWCCLLFLQWKSILIRTSQKRRRNIIYTFIVCLFLFQKWSNPHHSPLLKSWTKIDFFHFCFELVQLWPCLLQCWWSSFFWNWTFTFGRLTIWIFRMSYKLQTILITLRTLTLYLPTETLNLKCIQNFKSFNMISLV
jgi:hypothetical protein